MMQDITTTLDDECAACPRIESLFPAAPEDPLGRTAALSDVVNAAFNAINQIAGKDKILQLDQTPLADLGQKSERAVLNEIWIALEEANHLSKLLTECYSWMGEK